MAMPLSFNARVWFSNLEKIIKIKISIHISYIHIYHNSRNISMAAPNSRSPFSTDQFCAAEASAAYNENEVGAYAELVANLLPFPMVMQAAIELDLFDIIAGAERSGRRISATEIADLLPASDKNQAADKLDRMLRLLAAFSVVTSSVNAGGRLVYGLTPAGRYFARDEDGVSFGKLMVFHQDEVTLGSWRKLKDAVLEGGVPAVKAHGMNVIEYSNWDERFNRAFNQGMFNHTTIVMKKIIQYYNGFEKLSQLIDVGGDIGQVLKIIVSKYPLLKGINYDLPHVIEHALPVPGIEHVGGNMFESIPSPAEAIFMKWMLHGCNDEQCVKILKNCYNALPKNGKVIVVEHVLEDEPETTTTNKAVLLFDALMMTQSPSGRERTRDQYTILANEAGFTTIKFACCICNFWVMEFYK